MREGIYMKSSVLNLGIMLLGILIAISVGSLMLFFNFESNNIYGMALGIILFIVVLTFLAYLVYDLYSSIQDDFHNVQARKKKHIMHYRGL